MSKALIQRPTALGLALADAARRSGIDVDARRLPVKRETVWSATPRQRRKRR